MSHEYSSSLLQKLALPWHLQTRINNSVDFYNAERQTLDSKGESECKRSRHKSSSNRTADSAKPDSRSSSSYVLYLPFVTLRLRHNAAFALACRLANELDVPLVCLAIVPDQYNHHHHHPNEENFMKGKVPPVFLTARRLAFLLEALQDSTQQWSAHGALSLIRVHGPKCRSPDHLTLATRSVAVVTDEPFVHPWLHMVQSIERACFNAKVPCYRVDSSVTVPSVSKLTKRTKRETYSNGSSIQDKNGILWEGVPSRAFMWKARTKSDHMGHLEAALAGDFDAPPLRRSIPSEQQNSKIFIGNEKCCHSDNDQIESKSQKSGYCALHHLLSFVPSSWKLESSIAPGQRPWTTMEIGQITDLKHWSMNEWAGADTSVPPCLQTQGTNEAGMERWRSWLNNRNGLSKYANTRNDPTQPHAVSRMSHYLNYGIVSIFDLYNDIITFSGKNTYSRDKFIDEIIKWREFSHAHTFSRTDYFQATCVPSWARNFLSNHNYSSGLYGNVSPPTLDQMLSATTSDAKWNAMQRYLIRTGELHNNVRMTWGKTIVFWGKQSGWSCQQLLAVLALLNDRFALDGISPPSYAGLLWCCGWGDKPSKDGGINPKPASRYKTSPQGFHLAEERLLQKPTTLKVTPTKSHAASILSFTTKTPDKNINQEKSVTPTSGRSTNNSKLIRSKKNTLGSIMQYATAKRKRASTEVSPTSSKNSECSKSKDFRQSDKTVTAEKNSYINSESISHAHENDKSFDTADKMAEEGKQHNNEKNKGRVRVKFQEGATMHTVG